MFRYKFENALIRLFDTGRLEYDFHDLMEFMVYGLHQKGGEEKGLNSAFGTALTDAGAGDTICRQVLRQWTVRTFHSDTVITKTHPTGETRFKRN